MKKIKLLQFAVYISFAVFLIQTAGGDAWRGFKEGVNDGAETKASKSVKKTVLPDVVIGNLLPDSKNGVHKISDDYSLENISINADVRVNDRLLNPPFWLLVCSALLVIIIAILLFVIAYTINKVIYSIVKFTMFQADCQKLLYRAGFLLVIYFIIDYLYQQVSYIIQTHMISAPFSVVNTSEFNFGILVCAFLLLIIAEAFKQGARLKEEHDLTI